MAADRLLVQLSLRVTLSLVLLGCGAVVCTAGPPSTWVRVYAGHAFSFLAPAELRGGPGQGIDSFVGSYAAPGIRISFDYGWYTGCFVGGQKLHISGASEASLRTFDRKGNEADSLPYIVELCASPAHLDKVTRLGIWASCASQDRQSVAVEILKTVRFEKRARK